EWLALVSGTSTIEADRDLATVERVHDLVDTREALVRGELSLDQADEIAKTEQVCPGSEGDMLGAARNEPLRALKDRGRKTRAAVLDPEELHERQHKARTFRHWRDELGMVRISGAVVPEVGIPVVNRLDAETDRQWKHGFRSGKP